MEFGASELTAAGFTVKDLKDAGYTTADELRAAGCTVKDLKEGGYGARALKKGGYGVEDLLAGGFLTKVTAPNACATFRALRACVRTRYQASLLSQPCACEPVALC